VGVEGPPSPQDLCPCLRTDLAIQYFTHSESYNIFLFQLKVNRFSNVKDVIHDICKEYKLDHPRVRFSSTNTPVSLDANAALLEKREIIVDEARKESKDLKQG
jgi:hypothetical protein